MRAPTVVWFRLDLRLADHPALTAAAAAGPVVPVFVWSPEEEAPWEPGGASRWWLHRSLTALDASLRSHGSRLIIRRGPTAAALLDVAQATGARVVRWTRRYEPLVAARDRAVADALRGAGLETHEHPGSLLFEPEAVRTKAGQPFQVFTPFWKACLGAAVPAAALPAPRTVAAPAAWPVGLTVAALGLEPRPDWAAGLRAAWDPGEAGAADQLARFMLEGLASYPEERDRPGVVGTSRLSPHLHFGEISPSQAWHSVASLAHSGIPGATRGAEAWQRQLGWREFAHHLLVNFPHTAEQPLRADFARFPWLDDPAGMRAWERGRTGYPLVDAAMRELWTTGWMHNRARMIVASFLVKDLLLPWQDGARWFWDTLVDADLANNTLGWQWTAGCGADAAPYFRIFNPVSQGTKFDGAGAYVRRWVPELAKLPDGVLHAPWEASAAELLKAGVELGRSYPDRVVDHAEARDRALAALATITRR